MIMGQEICKAFIDAMGLKGLEATHVTIQVHMDDIVTATVTYFVEKEDAKNLIEFIQKGWSKDQLRTETYKLVKVSE